METPSIKQILKLKDDIRVRLEGIDINQFGDNAYGNEKEYTYKVIIGGLQSILTDISSLVNSPKYFIKYTTFEERNAIKEQLSNCLAHIGNPAYLFRYVDSLKIQLRSLQVRNSKLRSVEFSNEIDELIKKKQDVGILLADIKENKGQVQDILLTITSNRDVSEEKLSEFDELYKELEDKKKEVENNIIELEKRIATLDKIHDSIITKDNEIMASYQEVKSNEKIIDGFSKKVQNREKQLEFIESVTKEYLNKINDFTSERNKILEVANNLIESAKQALNYKTAEGLSASFKTQYDEEIRSKPNTWIIAALICLAVAIGLGVWILVDRKELEIIIGRIALIPLPIAGAVFCANQYIKRQNIIQDYAYKMVLAKSIVGFSEQFKKLGADNNEYLMYLRKAIDEIHQDPLRKRNKHDDEKDEIKIDDKLDKILNSIKEITKLKV